MSRRGAVDPRYYRPNFYETTGPEVHDALNGEVGAVVIKGERIPLSLGGGQANRRHSATPIPNIYV